MSRLVGFIFGAIAGLVAAAWLYGGSTWGPGFTDKVAGTQSAPQFKVSSKSPSDNPSGDPAPRVNDTAPPPAPSDTSPPPSTDSTNGSAPGVFNTGGNPNVEVGAGPNWGYGLPLGKSTNDGSGNRRGDLTRP